MNDIKSLVTLLVLYGALWAANTILAIRNNLKTGYTWDWKVFFNGVVKAGLGAFALTIGAIAISYIPLVFTQAGIAVDEATSKAISQLGILASVGSGVIIYARKFIASTNELFNPNGEIKVDIQPNKDNFNKGTIVLDILDLPTGAKADDATKRSLDEIVGGQGMSVDTTSADAFYSAVIGNGYDVDGYYGWQCWDGFALFTLSAYGKIAPTGNGAARGCWELKRDEIASYGMDLIYNKEDVRKGDWLIFGGTQWGHVGMSYSDNLGGYVKLLGQNQGGNPKNSAGGAAFNVINMSLNQFLGAFRPQKWHTEPAPTPTPTPEPTPQPTPSGEFQVGDIVVPTRLVDYNGTSLKQWDDNYIISEINGDRAVLMARGAIWAAMNTADIRKA